MDSVKRKWNVVLSALAVSVLGLPAAAAVPTEITTMFTDLVTDAGTIITSGVALMVAAFGVIWIIRYAKKVANVAR